MLKLAMVFIRILTINAPNLELKNDSIFIGESFLCIIGYRLFQILFSARFCFGSNGVRTNVVQPASKPLAALEVVNKKYFSVCNRLDPRCKVHTLR